MEKWTESLEQYLEEGKLPLVGEIFSRKKEIGDKLKLQREESHKITLSRKRKQSVGRRCFIFRNPLDLEHNSTPFRPGSLR